MSYRMILADSTKDIETRIGKCGDGNFHITVGEEEIIIPWQAADEIARYILKNS